MKINENTLLEETNNDNCLHCRNLKESQRTEESQIDFLVHYWSHSLGLNDTSIEKCEKYAKSLLKSIKIKIGLDPSILAETFQDKLSTNYQGFKDYLTANETEPKLPEEIDIPDIYQMFMEIKRDSFLREKNLDFEFEECVSYHEKLALELFFDKTECHFFSCYEKYASVKLPDVLRMGIMRKPDEDGLVLEHGLCFIHKTLAEYFVAETLIKELQLGNRNAGFQMLLIEKIFSEPEFQVIRTFFDCRLKKVVESLPGNIFEQYRSLTKEGVKCNCNLIHMLAKEGCTAILQLIFQCVDFKIVNIDEGFDIENVSSNDNSNTLNAIQYILKQGGVNITDNEGKTPLHHAAEAGQLEMVKFLIKHGANVALKDKEGETPLHSAAWKDRLEVIKQLVKLGVDVNIRDSTEETALITAAWRGRFHLVELLIALGADINATSEDDNTALIFAASRGHMDIVELLLELGPDIHAKDSCGDTPLHLAASRGHLSTVKFLAERGASVNMRDNDGQTPLHLTALSGELDIAKYLVELGVDVNAGDNNGNTPLHLATDGEHQNVVDFLVEYGVDIGIRNANGLTASQLTVLGCDHSDTH